MQSRKQVSAWFLALLTALVALGQLSIDLYLPSLPNLAHDLAIRPATAQLTLSAFLLGFALANIVHGPLADRFGRRPVLLAGLGVYALSTLGMIVAGDIAAIIGLRFLQAASACAASVVARAVVRDVYGAEGAGKIMSYLTAGGSVALAVGPAIGGIVAEYGGWRGNFGLLFTYGLIAFALAFFFLPETNPARSSAGISLGGIARTYGELLRNRIFTGHALCATAAYSGIFCFISASTFVLIDTMGMSAGAYGAFFGIQVLGFISGATISGRLNSKFGAMRLIRFGWSLSIVSSMTLVVLLTFAPSTAGIFVPMFFYEMSVGFIMGNAIGSALGPFPKTAGTASSLIGLLQTGSAAVLGVILGHLATLSAMPMAFAVLASGTSAALAHVFIVRPKAQSL